jgi:hypothetical protein
MRSLFYSLRRMMSLCLRRVQVVRQNMWQNMERFGNKLLKNVRFRHYSEMLC